MEAPAKKSPVGFFTCSARLWELLPVVFVFALVACGGGGAGPQPAPPAPSPDFTLSVTPPGVSVEPGGSASVSLSATGSNGFSAQVNVQVSGLPAGVTISPSAITLTPGTPLEATFSVDASAPASDATVTFNGSSGLLAHSIQMPLAVVTNIVSSPPPFRMRYVRTDATTSYFGWVNSHWIVYNPLTSRFFVTDPDSNRVFVLDASTQTLIGTIMVPGAYGIDDTPDHTTLYVGTQIGDVYAIDPVGMTVTKRFPSAGIGPSGFSAYSALVMADGRLALLGGQGGIPNVDGYSGFALWNAVDNSISVFTTEYGAGQIGMPATVVCSPNMGNIGVFTRTPDRTKVIIASIDSDGTLCEIDESTGTASSVGAGVGFVWHVAISPDGNSIVLPEYPGQAVVFDAQTLARVAEFSIDGDTSSAAEFLVGSDSQTLYVSSDSDVYAYSLSTGQQVGWFPNVVVEPLFGGSDVGPPDNPNIQAMDGTGLLVGPMEEGVGFLDITAMRTGAVGSQFLNGYLTPATGPASGGTATSWSVPNPFGPLSDVYFGSQKAASASGSSGGISAVTPPGVPGPADVSALTSDGGAQLLPEAFSYGPTVLQITPNAASSDGGTGFVVGYGLGPTNSSTIPSDLQISVGGKSATITEFTGNAYNSMAPPFPLEGAVYSIPQGAVGSGDVTVSTSAGSTTMHNGMTYLPAVQQFPLTGSALAEGVYDSQQDVYYFTDATKIQVFSRIAGAWLNPITLPAGDAPQRLWGIALSPNGSQLAIADIEGAAIYVLNPDNPTAVAKFSVSQPWAGVYGYPVGVAVSDAGMVYFTFTTPGISGAHGFFRLDTSSGQVTDYGVDNPGLATDNYLRTVITPDNSTVYFNCDGAVFAVDTSTDKVSYAKVDPGCCYGNYELSLSANQTRFAATTYFYDSNLNAEAYFGLNYREVMNLSYVYGQKLSPDGTMLFQPTTDGIDVLDARLGNLLQRIALPITLSPNYDALVSDGTDNVLLAITGANGDGVAVIDLTSIPEPSPLPYEVGVSRARRPTAVKSAPPARRGRPSPDEGMRSYSGPTKHAIPHVTSRKLLHKS
jgi:hypothetical protein